MLPFQNSFIMIAITLLGSEFDQWNLQTKIIMNIINSYTIRNILEIGFIILFILI